MPAGRPHVVVAVAHYVMRALIVDLLDRGFWAVSAVDSLSELGHVASAHPDLVIVDTGDFESCCRELPESLALNRLIVVGPEPDPAYRQAALSRGAGAWLSRDCVAEDLGDALRSALVRARVACPVAAQRTPESAAPLPKEDAFDD